MLKELVYGAFGRLAGVFLRTSTLLWLCINEVMNEGASGERASKAARIKHTSVALACSLLSHLLCRLRRLQTLIAYFLCIVFVLQFELRGLLNGQKLNSRVFEPCVTTGP